MRPGGAQRTPRLVAGSAAAVGSRLAGRLLGLGFVVVLARRQSPLVFAEYNYLLVLSAAISVITDAGVAAVAGREVARGQALVAAAYRSAITVQLATGLLGAAVVVGLGLVVPGPDRDIPALLFLAASVVATSTSNLQAELLRGSGLPLVEGGIQLVAGVLQLGVGSAVLYLGGGLTAVFAALAAKQVVVVVLSQAWLPSPWSVERDRSLARVVLRRGLWLGGATTLSTVVWRFGALVIGNAGSVSSLADFAVSSRYLEVSAMISQTLGIGMLPGLARRSSTSTSGTRRFTLRLALGLTGLACLLTVPAVLLTGRVTVAVFGARYQSAIAASQVLVAITPIVVLHYVLWYALVAERHERSVTVAAGAGALAALATVAWIVTRPSALVTAGATGIAIAVTTVALCVGAGRIRRDGAPVDVQLASQLP